MKACVCTLHIVQSLPVSPSATSQSWKVTQWREHLHFTTMTTSQQACWYTNVFSDKETVCAFKTLDKKQIFEQSFRFKLSKQGGLWHVPPVRQKQEAELGVCLWVWFYSTYIEGVCNMKLLTSQNCEEWWAKRKSLLTAAPFLSFVSCTHPSLPVFIDSSGQRVWVGCRIEAKTKRKNGRSQMKRDWKGT